MMSVTKVPCLSRLMRTRTAEQFFVCAGSILFVLILATGWYMSFLITCIMQSSPVDMLRQSSTLPSPVPVTQRILDIVVSGKPGSAS